MAWTNILGQTRVGVRGAAQAQVQTTSLLLDSYSGAAAAYSLRKLSGTYTGNAIRVRRSSDNTEMNIGFTAGGDLDTVSLLGFVGAGNSGMVTTWYDQSGSGKNATQISSSYQPQIVINGSLVTRNGKPALYFNGDMLSVSRVFSTSNFSVFGSISGSSGQVDSVVLAQHNGTADLGRTVFMSPNNEASPYDKLKTFFNNGTSYSIKSDTSVFNGTNKLISVNSDGSGNTYQFVNSTLVGSLMNVNWTPLNTNTTIGNYGMNGASSAYIGYIGELICYTTNKLINRVDIESNINSYYSIYSQPTQFLLDTYSGASAAYSLRKLSTSYTGNAIRVRRSSDNTEMDIGFDANGNLNTVSLLAFVGSGNGFVKTWYDQSGNSRNITQTTSSSQPNIVSNGSIVLRNSKPAIKFDGSDDYLWNSSAISVALRNNFSVFSIDAPAGSYHKGIWIWRGANNNSPSITTSSETRYIGVYPNSSKLFGDYPSAISYYVNNTSRNLTELSWDFGASTLPNANTTLNLVSLNQTSSVGNKYIVLGSDPYNIGLTTLNGCISEILFYENESTSISLINTNINSYYSIYLSDSDAQAFVTAAGITDTTQMNAINTLVTDLKSAGIWTKMKAIYPFVGGSAASHKWNLKDPRDLDAAFRLTFTGGWNHNSLGVVPNGTNTYADTKLNPTGNLTLNSTHISAYINDTGTGVLIGSDQTYRFWISPYYSSGPVRSSIFLNEFTYNYFNASTNKGLWLGSRINSSTAKLYNNSSVYLNSNFQSVALENGKIFIAARATGASSADAYFNKPISFSSIGDGLTDTEVSNFYTAIQAFQTTLGRAV